MTLPCLFISHGSPMFALDPGQLGPRLSALGRRLPRPRAVLVLSPHWMTRELQITGGARLDTIHDFGGFPAALYQLDYPAPAAPAVAREVVDMLGQSGLVAQIDPARGRDHGAWVPMMHLYPEADVPMIQLSQPPTPSPLALLELGQALAPLRERGILIIGSGSLTHNLYEIGAGPAATDHAAAFAAWVASRLASGDLESLLDYRRLCPDARRAHPTDEHFLPLFFALGAAGSAWTHVQHIDGGITYDALSMDSFVFGDTANEADRLDEVAVDFTEIDA
ncbi:dioxygenase [Nitrogeniibacter mangrovi]|uniref:Dioxygenase n=1 Tax=Nitrogeniibacter mangrovi TaxID=2016596 RepID=A0A6C1B2V6_9RHOO|nr:class III extradiol ring-cleavage dioxygenase [Nitrogeniibacter mangrovi]QID17982.1 dioxygenase [Nitrogeniibacter mangrovi]